MSAFTDSLRLGVARLASRRLFVLAMAVVPLLTTVFFVSLMHSGLPLRTPVGIVDKDLSPSSRKVTRMLNAEELLDIRYHYDSFEEAMAAVRTGESFGFFLIPENFERDAVAGKNPSLSLFTNMSFFVPGTLSFKGFKTGAVLTSGGLAQTKLMAVGMTDRATQALLQPVVIDTNSIGNPWTNYNYYLTNSFMPALLQLMILLVTVFTITEEIKTGRSVEWLRTADGSILRALAGKLLPQTVIWLLTGMAMLGMLYGFFHFPLNCHGRVHRIHDAEPAPGPQHRGPHRHPHILHRGVLLPRGEHVRRTGHLQLHPARALLFPHLHQPGSQRLARVLFALFLRSADSIPACGHHPAVAPQESMSETRVRPLIRAL